MIIDKFNRIHNYLRISLTDNCNLRCKYCMPEEDYAFMPKSQLMSAEELEQIASVFVSMGVEKIRLTGGEPLVRKDAGDIIGRLSKFPVKLTLTTNGTRLHEFTNLLQDAGVQSLNISLDTLDADKFMMLTRRDHFSRTMDNIHLMIERGFHVKLNMVVMKGINDNEIIDFIALTKNLPLHVRFIEFMPFTGNQWDSDKVITWQQIVSLAQEHYDVLPLEREKHDTAKKYIVPGHAGTFAVISTMSSHFCGDCNRMRLTADGKLKNCLFSQSEVDLLSPLRHGLDIKQLIQDCIAQKYKSLGGQFTNDFERIDATHLQNRSMIAIGG